jgi:1,2-diacylglycerol 3-beta-glucosyltransferase
VPFLRRSSMVPGQARNFEWHLLIPCRDEEAVIGRTLDNLLATFPQVHVWVVDDASEDATAGIVESFCRDEPRVHLVRRFRPNARTGKGDALNAAYRSLNDWLPPDHDRNRTIVGVVDADGMLAPNCLMMLASRQMFGDARVGGIQIEVRMSNRHVRRPYPRRGRLVNFYARTLLRLQDIEFRGPVSAIQLSRRLTRTVSLGGNGQFTRLAALDDLLENGAGPWRGALLEDFEIALHLLLAGWRNAYCPDTHVSQEGLWSMRRYVVQRTRWCQGTMQCAKYLPRVWDSTRLSQAGVLEVSYFLLQPWMQLLGSIVYPLPWLIFAQNVWRYPQDTWDFVVTGGWAMFGLYLVIGIGQFAIWGLIYGRRLEARAGIVRGLGWGVVYPFLMVTFYVIAWNAVLRIVRRRTGWEKTRRNSEGPVLRPMPASELDRTPSGGRHRGGSSVPVLTGRSGPGRHRLHAASHRDPTSARTFLGGQRAA